MNEFQQRVKILIESDPREREVYDQVLREIREKHRKREEQKEQGKTEEADTNTQF